MPHPYAGLTSETFLQFALILCRGFITVSTPYFVCPLLCARVCSLRCSVHTGRRGQAQQLVLVSVRLSLLFTLHRSDKLAWKLLGVLVSASVFPEECR